MRKFYKWSMVSSVAFMVMACGGEGQSFSSADNADNTVNGHTVNLSGSATKGTLVNANVALYGFESGTAFLLGGTKTNASGDYELTMPSDYRGPAKLVVSAAPGGGTTMVCDAPAGCGSTAFGQAVPVSPAMELTAYQREVLPGQAIQLHATPYTHLAASLVEAGNVDAASIAEATRQVANLFDLPGDFTSIKPADVTQTSEVAAASVVELRYSTLIAAFAGGDGEAMAQRLADYADSLTALGGQLPHTSISSVAPSLEQLYTSARVLADQLDSNLLRSEFDARLASLEDGKISDAESDGSNAKSYGELIAAAMDDAERLEGMLSEEALNLYLGSQREQLEWVLTDDLVPSLMVSVDVFKLVLVGALASDVVTEYADASGMVDLSSITSTSGYGATLDVNNQTLHYFKVDTKNNDYKVDMVIDITPVIDGLLPAVPDSLDYEIKAGSYVHNPSFMLDFTRGSRVRFEFPENDDFSSVQLMLKYLMGVEDKVDIEQKILADDVVYGCFEEVYGRMDIPSSETRLYWIDCVVNDFLAGLDASGELAFGATLTETGGSQQFDVDFKGYGDIDLTNPAAPTLLNLEIRDGHFYAPNGDKIYTIGSEKGLVLNLGNSDNAMFARFGVESALVPTTVVTASTQYHDLQDYLDTFNASGVSFDFNRLRVASMMKNPLVTIRGFVNDMFLEEQWVPFMDYLMANTTPGDYVKTMNLVLDIQPDADWPGRSYHIDLQGNIIEVSNQDGVRFKYSAEPGAIVSRIAVDGTDLVEVRVTEDGVQVTDIEDAVTLDPTEIPSESIMAVFARLDELIELDQQARDLLSQYENTVSF